MRWPWTLIHRQERQGKEPIRLFQLELHRQRRLGLAVTAPASLDAETEARLRALGYLN